MPGCLTKNFYKLLSLSTWAGTASTASSVFGPIASLFGGSIMLKLVNGDEVTVLLTDQVQSEHVDKRYRMPYFGGFTADTYAPTYYEINSNNTTSDHMYVCSIVSPFRGSGSNFSPKTDNSYRNGQTLFNYAMIVGDGTTIPTPDDYNLSGNNLTDAFNRTDSFANTGMHPTVAYLSASLELEDNGFYSLVIDATATNHSNETKTIKEFAIFNRVTFKNDNANTSAELCTMLARYVLETPLVVPAGKQMHIRCKMKL